MSKTSLNNCPKCEHGDNMDCASCKLASLTKRSNKDTNAVEDDDYSISERLTENKNDYSILMLFIAAALILLSVVGFTLLFK